MNRPDFRRAGARVVHGLCTPRDDKETSHDR